MLLMALWVSFELLEPLAWPLVAALVLAAMLASLEVLSRWLLV